MNAEDKSFNSMIVRLKEHDVVFTFDDVRGFNSMIVRLKGEIQFPKGVAGKSFQFYDSPIKRFDFVIQFEI